MSERPILFSGEMVRAILEGRKSMTRRVVKPQPDLSGLKPAYRDLQFEFRKMPVLGPTHIPPEWGFCAKHDKPDCVPIYCYRCPYGQPGNRLWVRETWQQHEDAILYRADDVAGHIITGWRPSIHMPRWASRITLEVVSVRVERVQEISEADAECEGVEPASAPEATGARCKPAFRELWDSINGKKPGRSWADNPWVWVLEFKRV